MNETPCFYTEQVLNSCQNLKTFISHSVSPLQRVLKEFNFKINF